MVSDSQLLTIWERGYSATPLGRAVLLSTIAAHEGERGGGQDVIDLPIGVRDRRLMHLRRVWFGNQVQSMATCPKCKAQLEMTFEIDQLVKFAPEAMSSNFSIQWQGRPIEFRCPTTSDLISVVDMKQSRISAVLQRCLIQSEDQSQLRPVELDIEIDSPEFQRAVSSAIESHDPLAHVEFDMECNECHSRFSAPFDIVNFLWSELNAWCQRMMNDVHVLAKAYGWTETEILGLGAWRRQVYLNMIRQ